MQLSCTIFEFCQARVSPRRCDITDQLTIVYCDSVAKLHQQLSQMVAGVIFHLSEGVHVRRTRCDPILPKNHLKDWPRPKTRTSIYQILAEVCSCKFCVQAPSHYCQPLIGAPLTQQSISNLCILPFRFMLSLFVSFKTLFAARLS